MSRATLAPAAEPAFDAPAVLDIEASGFGRDSYPVEVGFVLPGARPHDRRVRHECQF